MLRSFRPVSKRTADEILISEIQYSIILNLYSFGNSGIKAVYISLLFLTAIYTRRVIFSTRISEKYLIEKY